MQQLMVSFEGYAPPADILAGVRKGEISSFCLFSALNVQNPAQLRELTNALHRAAQEGGCPPPLIGIDQEGGQLIAITGGATELPGNMALGATRSPELAKQAGYVLGRELRAMGLNLNFAPSVDVNINPANPVVGIRSFGAEPQLVSDLGAALIQGMQAEGVIATAKHFPGHGDTMADSHHDLSVINHSLERIEAVELAPFRAAIQADVKAIITAHILFSELDTQQPATLSSIILTDLLRQQMGFTGVIITDAMDMDAVARLGARESVQMALNAGADLILLGHLRDQLAMFDDLRSMAHPAALERIQALRTSTLGPDPALDVVGCIEHRQIAQTIADRSITLVKNTVQAVPLHPNSDTTIAVITPQPLNLTPADTSALVNITLANAIRRRHPRVTDYQLASQNDIAAILEATRQANIVVVGTICAEQDAVQAELVQALLARGQHPIVVSLRTPYDLIAFPQIETYLCAYGIRDVTTEAVARVLFGEIEAAGILPCPIPNL